jgi:FHA domain-containing protein
VQAALPAATPASAATPGAAGADAAALWRAFCEGAGVDLPPPPGDGAALMRHMGRIMRTAVDGTLQLMAVRASTKHEMRAAVTQIQASNNNPLKFAPDGAAGLEALVSPPQRGFLDGASAMDDAMLDLVGHSIGTVAGMRAAIEGMLKRFEPEALESKLGAGSPLANLLPMNRKARLWELYLQHHRQIRDEAEEDFHTLFGRAFVAAYEQQVERLKRRGRP